VVIGFTRSNSFTDHTTVSGKSYNYQVKAANEYGSLSGPSNVVTYLNTGLYDFAENQPVISVVNSYLNVKDLSENTTLSLVSVDGRTIFTDSKCSDTFTKHLPQLKGVYVLSINNKSYKVIF
jgi:hypothetical protein